MPRLTNSLPRYRKHKSSGQAVVSIAGRDFYLGPHGTKASKAEYDRLVAEWLAAGRSATFGAKAASSVGEVIVAFMRHAKEYYGVSAKGSYATFRYVLRPLRMYSSLPANEFGAAQFKAVRQSRIDGGNCRKNINRTMKRIIQVFRWAAAEGMISETIPARLALIQALRKGKTAAAEKPPVRPVADSEVDATLPHLGDVVADMVRLQRLTGMRPAEVCGVRPCDIERSGEVWRYQPPKHKTEYLDKDRIVFIGPQAQAILLKYLARESESNCFRPDESEQRRRAEVHAARTTPLSCGNRPGTNRRRKPMKMAGAVYSVDSYRRAIHRACDKAFPAPAEVAADVDALKKWRSDHRWSPNQLRHATATDIRREFGLEAAQIILGHSSADVTQIYAERDAKLAASVARQVG